MSNIYVFSCGDLLQNLKVSKLWSTNLPDIVVTRYTIQIISRCNHDSSRSNCTSRDQMITFLFRDQVWDEDPYHSFFMGI
jgi:hypothetical protein